MVLSANGGAQPPARRSPQPSSPPCPPPVEGDRGAAATRPPPPPDQVAAFFSVVDKGVVAAALCRHSRRAELSGQAAAQAAALYGEASLIFVNCVNTEVTALINQSNRAAEAERGGLLRRAWALLLSVHPILLRRFTSNTLFPTTLRREESDFYVYTMDAAYTAQNKPKPSSESLQEAGQGFGYLNLIDTLTSSLLLLPVQRWPAAQIASVQSFVLDALDVIPHSKCVRSVSGYESDLVCFIDDMPTRSFDPAFRDAVLRKWRSPAVSSVLRLRGVLQTAVAQRDEQEAEFSARRRADVEKVGFRGCALPSCEKVEHTVKEFPVCTGCRSV